MALSIFLIVHKSLEVLSLLYFKKSIDFYKSKKFILHIHDIHTYGLFTCVWCVSVSVCGVYMYGVCMCGM